MIRIRVLKRKVSKEEFKQMENNPNGYIIELLQEQQAENMNIATIHPALEWLRPFYAGATFLDIRGDQVSFKQII